MIFAKMYHDKSAPAGDFTQTTFTKDFDPSSLSSFSPCVMFLGAFFFQQTIKSAKTTGSTQANRVQITQEMQG